jgi:hypothetical protein
MSPDDLVIIMQFKYFVHYLLLPLEGSDVDIAKVSYIVTRHEDFLYYFWQLTWVFFKNLGTDDDNITEIKRIWLDHKFDDPLLDSLYNRLMEHFYDDFYESVWVLKTILKIYISLVLWWLWD